MLPHALESPRARRRWSFGRVATWLAIIAVVVPASLQILTPPMRGECATTGDNAAIAFGLMFLGARLAWLPLKAANDAFERRMAAREARRHPSTPSPGPPPTP